MSSIREILLPFTNRSSDRLKERLARVAEAEEALTAYVEEQFIRGKIEGFRDADTDLSSTDDSPRFGYEIEYLTKQLQKGKQS